MATANRAAWTNPRGHHGVHEPDIRIVFAVLAVAMLVGALLGGSSEASADLQPPAAAKAR